MILGHKPFPFPSWLHAYSSLSLLCRWNPIWIISVSLNTSPRSFISTMSTKINENAERSGWNFLCLLSISNVSPQLIILFSLVLHLMRKIKCARSFVLQFFFVFIIFLYSSSRSNKKGTNFCWLLHKFHLLYV